MTQEIWKQQQIINWSQLLLNSYEKFLRHQLIERKGSREEQAQALFFAPVVVVSHGTEADPIFNYANQTALKLWEMNWEEFTQMPSRQSAEISIQEERKQLLEQAGQQNFIDNYRGVRIGSTGKRFLIEKAIVWNLVNIESKYCGQAATFSQWSFL
ncbi:MAG: MEKHLA domain-containing protein [Gomphosphaeria aponina SAG 52.96 = DSM 107014]|uniref:MEKHLA domain-containing protein n=1 Tax=Gomphosphaeria aponina SAG 52.96 = DSM 107014 TaxID=1521640 RepID=A0A941GRB1_9CHRO|nr:MEKHLA domain-containing protein [Gomphosphaeria aponina SAG 52.96 = DSM 107014]